MKAAFQKMAQSVSTHVGSPFAFLVAFMVVLMWAVSGPVFGFSDTWQLVINTCTTIVTFLMVFLIQNTQNRDGRAVQMKLNELIIYTKGADNGMVELENLSDEELDRLEAQFHRLARTLGREDVLRQQGAMPSERRRDSRSSGRRRASKQNGHSKA